MTAIETQVVALQRQVRRLQQGLVVLAVLVVGLPLLALRGRPPEVLRARGIVLEDAEGRDRILIGAPVPDSAHRIRTSFERASAAWGERFPDMEWYRTLDHHTNGMLVLDENGHDRIAVGDPTPDPNVGRRVEPSTGIAINDEQGFERSGWGYFRERDQVGLGLDRRSGEALNLFAVEHGASGMLIRSAVEERWVYVGHAGAGNFVTGVDRPVSGVVVRDPDGPRVLLDAAPAGALELRNEHGEVTEKLPLE